MTVFPWQTNLTRTLITPVLYLGLALALTGCPNDKNGNGYTEDAPSGISYPTNPATYSVGVAIADNTPSVTGGTATSFNALSLPAGLQLNTSTGTISGTPTASTATSTYLITAANSAGAFTTGVTITITAAATTDYTVTPSGSNVTISPSSVQTVSSGAKQSFLVTATAGYMLSSSVAGNCPAGGWNGSTYTTGTVTSNCTVIFSANPVNTPPSLSIVATVNSTTANYYSLWGICNSNAGIIKLTFSGNGTGYTYVPCIGGSWVYNEAYYSGGAAVNWVATQSSQTASLILDAQTTLASNSTMPQCTQPYTWQSEMISVFGTLSCHEVATCANGRTYVYADAVSQGCVPSSIYVATYTGLSIASVSTPSSFTTYTTGNGLSNNNVDGVYVSGGFIYAATIGGLSIASVSNPSSFASYTNPTNAQLNQLESIYVTPTNIYLGTDGGLVISPVSNPGSFSNYTTANGLGSNYVWGVYVSANYIYAATAAGLSIAPVSNPSSFTNYTTSNGLGDNNINSVYVTATNIYAATCGGLSIASVSNPGSFTNYSGGGLPYTNSGYCLLGSVFADSNNIYVTGAGHNAGVSVTGELSIAPVSNPNSFTAYTGLSGYTGLSINSGNIYLSDPDDGISISPLTSPGTFTDYFSGIGSNPRSIFVQ